MWSNTPLDVCFLINNIECTVHATNTCYTKRCNPHLGLVAIISII